MDIDDNGRHRGLMWDEMAIQMDNAETPIFYGVTETFNSFMSLSKG